MKNKLEWLNGLSWDSICAPIASAVVATKIGEIISEASYVVNIDNKEGYVKSLPVPTMTIVKEAILIFLLFFGLWFLFRYGIRIINALVNRYKHVKRFSQQEIVNNILREKDNLVRLEEELKQSLDNQELILLYFRRYVDIVVSLRRVLHSPNKSQQKIIHSCFRENELLSPIEFSRTIPSYEFESMLSELNKMKIVFENRDSLCTKDCKKLDTWLTEFGELV